MVLGMLLFAGILGQTQEVIINVLSAQDPFFFALEKALPQFEKRKEGLMLCKGPGDHYHP